MRRLLVPSLVQAPAITGLGVCHLSSLGAHTVGNQLMLLPCINVSLSLLSSLIKKKKKNSEKMSSVKTEKGLKVMKDKARLRNFHRLEETEKLITKYNV